MQTSKYMKKMTQKNQKLLKFEPQLIMKVISGTIEGYIFPTLLMDPVKLLERKSGLRHFNELFLIHV